MPWFGWRKVIVNYYDDDDDNVQFLYASLRLAWFEFHYRPIGVCVYLMCVLLGFIVIFIFIHSFIQSFICFSFLLLVDATQHNWVPNIPAGCVVVMCVAVFITCYTRNKERERERMVIFEHTHTHIYKHIISLYLQLTLIYVFVCFRF